MKTNWLAGPTNPSPVVCMAIRLWCGRLLNTLQNLVGSSHNLASHKAYLWEENVPGRIMWLFISLGCYGSHSRNLKDCLDFKYTFVMFERGRTIYSSWISLGMKVRLNFELAGLKPGPSQLRTQWGRSQPVGGFLSAPGGGQASQHRTPPSSCRSSSHLFILFYGFLWGDGEPSENKRVFKESQIEILFLPVLSDIIFLNFNSIISLNWKCHIMEFLN